MRRGPRFTLLTVCSLALIGCGAVPAESDSQAAESGTGDETSDAEGNEAEGEAEASEAEADGHGDGDGDGDSSGDGDGDPSGDGDGNPSGDGDGDPTGDGDGDPTGDGDGDPSGDGDGDPTGDGDGEPDCGTTLYSTVRDFQISHPDFQYTLGVDPGIVAPELGPDQKPVYAGNPDTPTTTGADNFNQWYNDVPGVNMSFEVPIELVEIQPGLYQYANSEFFPIDDQGFGNEGNPHNYHFTLELHTSFRYLGGEVFSFEGDDDLWVFVNGKLGIDLGGVHGPLAGSIDMDAMAATLGLELGNVYALDFFFAERHTTQSNFKITTTISCFVPQ